MRLCPKKDKKSARDTFLFGTNTLLIEGGFVSSTGGLAAVVNGSDIDDD